MPLTAPPEHRAMAIEMYLSSPSITIRQVADRMGYCRHTIIRWLRGTPRKSRTGIKRAPYKPRTRPDPRRKVDTVLLKTLLAEGVPKSEIARQMGVTRQAINWNLRCSKWMQS